MGITDYGHRGVPNVYLSATLKSDGPWQAAHYSNPAMDKLITSYIAATDLQTQKGLAKQIQELCLEDTPIIQSGVLQVGVVDEEGRGGRGHHRHGPHQAGQGDLGLSHPTDARD